MSKSHYELTFIVDGNIPDTENNRITEEIQTSMKTSGAEVNYCQELGRKKLSYEIKKSQRGTYFVIEFDSEPNSLKSIEKDLKLNKNILRYLIVTKPRNIAQIKPENVKDQTELKSTEKMPQQRKEEKSHKEKAEKKEEDKKEERSETEKNEVEPEPEKETETEKIQETIQEEEIKQSDDLDKKLDEILNKDEF